MDGGKEGGAVIHYYSEYFCRNSISINITQMTNIRQRKKRREKKEAISILTFLYIFRVHSGFYAVGVYIYIYYDDAIKSGYTVKCIPDRRFFFFFQLSNRLSICWNLRFSCCAHNMIKSQTHFDGRQLDWILFVHGTDVRNNSYSRHSTPYELHEARGIQSTAVHY